MADSRLAARFMDLFERQIAFYREALAQHERLATELDADDYTDLLARQKRMAATSQSFADEFKALSSERGRSDPFAQEEYADLKARAQEVKALADELMQRHVEAVRLIRKRMGALDSERNDLRRGLGMLRKYRPGSLDDGGFMDKEA